MKVNGKILRIPRKDFVSIRFSIVHNFRRFGIPQNKQIASFGTVRSTDVNIPSVRREFWNKVEKTLLRLLAQDEIMVADAETIREKFAELVPKPSAVPLHKPTTPVPDRRSVMEKYGLASPQE